MRHANNIILFFIATRYHQRPTMSLAAGSSRGSSTTTTTSSTSWPKMERPSLPLTVKDSDVDDYQNSSSVPAIMNYVSAETTEMSTRRDLGGGDSTFVGVIWEPKHVAVYNARLATSEMTLEKNGFQLHRSAENALQEIDFCHQDDVVDNYYPLCEKLLTNTLMKNSFTPITCVCAFDHNVRSNDHSSVGEIKASKQLTKDVGTEHETPVPQVQKPAGIVHADYTRVSGPRRLGDLSKQPKLNDVLRPKLLSQNRSSLLDPNTVQEALDGKRRYAFINVWRSIDEENPVKDNHLACIDSQTVDKRQLRVFRIHYADRVGENYFACPASPSNDKQHSWYYYPDMTMEEALLIKQWDSKGDIADGSEHSTFAIHSAFLDPTAPKDAPPRKSIEVRCIVIWDKE